MTCEKTGAHIYLEQYGAYAVCDAFYFWPNIPDKILYTEAWKEANIKPVTVFHIAGTSREPLRPTLHYRVNEVEEWIGFGQKILVATDCEYLGYEGVPI